jgi:hypothetical protein
MTYGLLLIESQALAEDAASCQPVTSFHYDYTANQLTLQNSVTQEVIRQIDIPDDMTDFIWLGASPDCRLGAGSIQKGKGRDETGDTIIWDMATGDRIGTFEDSHQKPHRIHWSPDSAYLVVETRKGAFLWQPYSNLRTQLSTHSMDSWWAEIAWDTSRGKLFVLSNFYNTIGDLQVDVFDYHTGAKLASVGTASVSDFQLLGFTLANDGSRLIVFPRHVYHASITVWDSDTGEQFQVDAAKDGAPSADHVALSPDNRYLVVGRYFIRVWDLQNLPEKLEDRVPVYFDGPEASIKQVRFTGSTTIETTDAFGVVQQWDILTGALLAS